MDKEQKGKITSNLTFLKDRLGFLDPILDRLVEKDVLSFEQKEKIENVYPCTPHKKFNEFISILVSSPSPIAFTAFLRSLEEEGYHNITEKLTKESTRVNSSRSQLQTKEARIGVSPQFGSRSTTDQAKTQSVVEYKFGTVEVSKPESSNGPSDSIQIATLQRMFSDLRGKLTSDLLEGFERQRQQEKMEQEINFERKRQEDRIEFELKMEEKMQCLRIEFKDTEKNLNRNIELNQEIIGDLHEKVKKYRESTESYIEMKDKYDKLQYEHEQIQRKYQDIKQSYKNAKNAEEERFQTLRDAKRENNQLKQENKALEDHVEDVTKEIKKLKREKKEMQEQLNNQDEISQLLAEKEDLQRELDKTKNEVSDLWQCVENQEKQIDSQAKEIQRLMAMEHEKCPKDNKEYDETLKRQSERLEELFEAVKDLKEKQARNRISQKQTRQFTKNKN